MWCGCWCQTGWCEYFRHCWCAEIFRIYKEWSEMRNYPVSSRVEILCWCQRRITRLLWADRKTTATQSTTLLNEPRRRASLKAHLTLKQMGHSNRRPHWGQQLSANNRGHIYTKIRQRRLKNTPKASTVTTSQCTEIWTSSCDTKLNVYICICCK